MLLTTDQSLAAALLPSTLQVLGKSTQQDLSKSVGIQTGRSSADNVRSALVYCLSEKPATNKLALALVLLFENCNETSTHVRPNTNRNGQTEQTNVTAKH